MWYGCKIQCRHSIQRYCILYFQYGCRCLHGCQHTSTYSARMHRLWVDDHCNSGCSEHVTSWCMCMMVECTKVLSVLYTVLTICIVLLSQRQLSEWVYLLVSLFILSSITCNAICLLRSATELAIILGGLFACSCLF